MFAVSIDHAHALAIAFGEECQGVPIQVIHSRDIPRRVPSEVHPDNGSSLSAEERQRIHQRFRCGDIQILISVNIYTMGVDFPAVETLFMARPTLSPVVYSQMLGRGLRGPAFEGAESVRVIDFADQVDTHDHLRNRIMDFQRFRDFADDVDKEIAEMKKLSAQRQTCRPAEFRQQLMGKSGIYRVTRDYRDWRAIADIGKAVSKRLQDKTIRYYDTVTYVLEDDGKRRGKILSLLRLAKLDSDACGF